MGKIDLTAEQKRELEANNSLILPLEGAVRSGRGTYHNPVTGMELRNSPMDNWHMWLRLRQGWKLGPASPELRAKWAAGEENRRKADDAMVEEHVASDEHRESEKSRFDDAVKEATAVAVTAVLEKLEIDLPGKTGAESTAPAPAPEGEPEGVQLPLWGSDATPETDTKLIVSEASQPALQLVGQGKE